MKWYVEYKHSSGRFWVWDGISGIEAKDADEAIKIAKHHAPIDAWSFEAQPDDEEAKE